MPLPLLGRFGGEQLYLAGFCYSILAGTVSICCFGALISKSCAPNQMEQATNDTIIIFIMIGVLFFEAVIGIASVLRRGVLKDQRVLLMKKTNVELRSMLHGVNKISRLPKRELVELVVATC